MAESHATRRLDRAVDFAAFEQPRRFHQVRQMSSSEAGSFRRAFGVTGHRADRLRYLFSIRQTSRCLRATRTLRNRIRWFEPDALAHADGWSGDEAAASAARRSTSSMISDRCPGASLRKAFSNRSLSIVSLDGAPSFFCSSATNVGFFISHLLTRNVMASPGKREDGVQKVDPTAIEAERLGPDGGHLNVSYGAPVIERADSDGPGSMPRKNHVGKAT
jgi:hypothetical protein